MTDGPTIAASIVCRNEADRLGDRLASVTWADEIVVVDLESDDGSADVARRYGARVITHPRVPIVELVRNFAADATTAVWILALDPDERVEPALAEELRRLSVRAELDVVEIPFMNFDLGFPATHPLHRYDPKPRMYRRERVRWPEAPNELPKVDRARTYRIPPRDELVIRHERNRNLPEILDRVLRYAPAEAQAMLDRGESFTAARMTRTLGRKIYKQFVAAKPYDDGVPGLLRGGVLVAFHFYVWFELWQRSGVGRTAQDDRHVARLGRAVAAAALAARAARGPAKALRALRRRP